MALLHLKLLKWCRMANRCSATPKEKPKVLVIAGSTSVGKTDLSLELAGVLNGEIISADSVQVYRSMDIGSAKINPDSCQSVPHHLIDIVNIRDPFSSADFSQLADKAIMEILSRGHVPMVVGGTGLYIRTLMEGATGAPPSTGESKEMVEEMVKEDGEVWETRNLLIPMQKAKHGLARLRTLDPEYATTLNPNDWYRLKRGLEICTLSGRTVTSFKREFSEDDCEYNFRCLFLTMPRVPLFQRIDARCEVIVEQGLFTEVISLVRDHGLVLDSQAGRSVGYRQALEYLKSVWGFPPSEIQGTLYCLQIPRDDIRRSFLEFLLTYQAKTRQLSGVQSIWFKKSPKFHWLNLAPGGQRLPLDSLVRAVVDWFTNDAPLPRDWDGKPLQSITKEERRMLIEYGSKHSKLNIYSDLTKVDSMLQKIEHCLQVADREQCVS